MGEHVMPDRASGVSETELRDAVAEWWRNVLADYEGHTLIVQGPIDGDDEMPPAPAVVLCESHLNSDPIEPPLASIPAEPEQADEVAGLDAAYRERNAVVAALIRTNGWPTWVIPAPDADGWWIVYAETPQGQVSWHFGARDLDLFPNWPTVAVRGWDRHATEEKYRRLARLVPARDDTSGGALDVERIEAVLRAHQWRSHTFSCSCGLVFATGHIQHVAALVARLAPARDDTSVDRCDCPKCGEWRDSPTADCAACGFDPARDDTSGPLPGGNG